MAINIGFTRCKNLMRLACCMIPWLAKCQCSRATGIWHQSLADSTVVSVKDRNNNVILILRGLSMKQVSQPDVMEAQVKHIKLDPVPDLSTPAVQRRKFALLLSFCGKGYHGMQKNEYFRSIENDLLGAMLAANLITEEEYKIPQLFYFQRVSRTDKGVSAARLLVSASLPGNVPNMKEEISKHLCDQIRVMATYRTTRAFNCKLWCDSRTYSYLCPTFAFAPFTEITREGYRMTPEVLKEVRRLLNMYKGTHNFHNFTSQIPQEARAIRNIIDIDCGKPFISDSLEWITIRIRGQSFVLHQIRKMIGLIMAISRGLADANFITEALTENYVNLPIAPALGLVLEEQHFDYYNKKFGSDGIHEPLKWDKSEKSIQKFREQYISASIVNTEIQEKSMLKWLTILHFHAYEIYSASSEIKDKNQLKEKHSQVKSPIWYAYRRLGYHRTLENSEDNNCDDDDDDDDDDVGHHQLLTDS
ncbi:pseudouridylate synthase 1 homolog isoform X2 [Panulirus ornatus]|uniref:pseudouridylate synthase 1 homolog isoform X2 n=1 Tax=Panulirus ornatus TaxID=150431 RepID=UPI003A8C64CA